MDTRALKRAIRLAGGQSALAAAIGGKVRQGSIWNWLYRDGKVPAQHCIPIETALGGAVTRYQLRPDVFGKPPPSSPKPLPPI